MIAGRQRIYNENLIREKGLRILPTTVIYGANASGKSNIIMSLALMREMILSGSLDKSDEYLSRLELFPFIHSESTEPIEFEIEFIHNECHVCYRLGISVGRIKKTKRRIAFEELTLINRSNKSVPLFRRDENKIEIMKDKKALDIIDFKEGLLVGFESQINKNLDDAVLFLSGAFKSTISSKIADAIIDFFRDKLIVISDFTLKQANLVFATDDRPKKDFFAWNNILDGFVKNSDFGPQSILFRSKKSDDGRPAEIQSDDTTEMQLVSIYEYGDQSFMLPAEVMESRGTLKLLDFAIPFADVFNSGGVFVLDEFDASIHPEIIKGILALFNNADINKNKAQLIFTTHNPIYLSSSIFRRDQIRFIEKNDETYESIIYSLDDLEKVRNDHNYLINYFKGNYGALPYQDFSKLLEK